MKLRILLILIAVIFIFHAAIVQAEINIPDTIRVGLKFNTTAPASVRISSITGLEFGYREGTGFTTIFTYGNTITFM